MSSRFDFSDFETLSDGIPDSPGPKHYCQLCTRQFDTQHDLACHKRDSPRCGGVRSPEPALPPTPKHLCSWCERKFTERAHLETHCRVKHPAQASRAQHARTGAAAQTPSPMPMPAQRSQPCNCEVLDKLMALLRQAQARGCQACAGEGGAETPRGPTSRSASGRSERGSQDSSDFTTLNSVTEDED